MRCADFDPLWKAITTSVSSGRCLTKPSLAARSSGFSETAATGGVAAGASAAVSVAGTTGAFGSSFFLHAPNPSANAGTTIQITRFFIGGISKNVRSLSSKQIARHAGKTRAESGLCAVVEAASFWPVFCLAGMRLAASLATTTGVRIMLVTNIKPR